MGEQPRTAPSSSTEASLLDLVPDALIATDARGSVTFWNAAAERLYGVAREDAVGAPLVELCTYLWESPEAERAANDALAVKGEWRGENVHVLRTGERRHVEAAVRAMRAADGAPAGMVAAVRDVTERRRMEKALRESERVYRAIGETIDYGVWVCAPDGRNVYASDSFLKLVGLTQEQCSEFGWGDVLHPEDAERTIAAWKECVRTGGKWDIEHRFRGVDGGWHSILARGVPVRGDAGEVICWAGINLDISRLKQAEEALRDADRRKDEFIGMLSHEFRNPLAAINNAVALLKAGRPDGEQAGRARGVIERQMAHLTRLVDDLLDVARITRGKVQLQRERLDLVVAVGRVVEDQRATFGERGIGLELQVRGGAQWVSADGTRVAQIVGNLLHNAAKFTPSGGHVTVTAEREDGAAVIRVRDTGVGIEPELLPRLFQPFVQADAPAQNPLRGLGLGLAVSRALVELHGGTLRASSEGHGKGAEFVVRLPALEAVPVRQTSLPRAAEHARRRILIVEDNEDVAMSLRDVLELQGHEVVLAHDGRHALDAALRERPDVVLCDVGLPDVDGYELARRLRALGTGARLVAVTGYATPEDVARARAAGFDDHLAKPADLDKLAALLARTPVAERRAG